MQYVFGVNTTAHVTRTVLGQNIIYMASGLGNTAGNQFYSNKSCSMGVIEEDYLNWYDISTP